MVCELQEPRDDKIKSVYVAGCVNHLRGSLLDMHMFVLRGQTHSEGVCVLVARQEYVAHLFKCSEAWVWQALAHASIAPQLGASD